MTKQMTTEPGDGVKRRPPVPRVVRWEGGVDGRVRHSWYPGFVSKHPSRIPEGWATEGSPQAATMKKAVEEAALEIRSRASAAGFLGQPAMTDEDYRYSLDKWNGFFASTEGSTGGFGTLPARPRRRDTEEFRKARLLDADHGVLDYLMDARWPAEARGEAAPAWEAWRAAQPWAAEADALIAAEAAAAKTPEPETMMPPPPARRPPPSRQVRRSS